MNGSFLIEVSARHVHLSRAAIDILLGEGFKLVPKKSLSQPGQYVSESKVDIIGPRGILRNVSVLGPEREFVQVELSLTDARALGIDPPIRESGDIADSAGCVLVGPEGKASISDGVIVSQRHIHANPKEAKLLCVENGDVVWVSVKSNARRLVFGDVIVRVSKDYSLAMHIDTDELNAMGCDSTSRGVLFYF